MQHKLCLTRCVAVTNRMVLVDYLWGSCTLLLSGKVPTIWTLLSQPFCCWVNGIFMVGFSFHGEDGTTFTREFLEFGRQSSAGVNLGPCC